MQEQYPVKELKILHFNDVYNISDDAKNEVCGGIARFAAKMQEIKEENPETVVLFSGDLWSPSRHTTIFHGDQITDPINQCHIDCACLGNHDLDLGLDKSGELNARCHFPWLLSNVIHLNGKRIVCTHEYHIVRRKGWRIGVIGLAEYGWLASLNAIDIEQVIYDDFVTSADRLSEMLREDYKCNLIIALTHMRVPNDKRLAEKCKDVDLILGGHDHIYRAELRNEILVLKSGSDYKNFTEIDLKVIESDEKENISFTNDDLNDDNVVTGKEYTYNIRDKFKASIKKRDITRDIVPVASIQKHVDFYDEKMHEAMKRTVCYCKTELDAKFSSIRSGETKLGNFICDLIRKHNSSDCSILNSGTIRADRVYKEGFYTIGDWNDINPYRKGIDKVEVTGELLLRILECGMAKTPALDGRFPQVSKLEFEVDISKPPFERIDPAKVKVAGVPLDLEQKYTITTNSYLTSGKDGYECFPEATPLLDKGNLTDMADIIQSFFDLVQSRKYREEFKVYKEFYEEISMNFIRKTVQQKLINNKNVTDYVHHWRNEDGEVYDEVPLQRKSSYDAMKDDDTKQIIDIINRHNVKLVLAKRVRLTISCLIRLRMYQLVEGLELSPEGELVFVINPKLQGRIKIVGGESLEE